MIVASGLSSARYGAGWGWLTITPYGAARNPDDDDATYGQWTTTGNGTESLRLEQAGDSYRLVIHEQRRYVLTIAPAAGFTFESCRWGGSVLPPLYAGEQLVVEFDTGNAVGLSKLTVTFVDREPVEILLRIANRKLEADEDFEWLVSDLARSVRAIALKVESSTQLPTTRHARERSFGYEDLIFLASVVEDMRRAMDRILERPHRKLAYETVWRDAGSVSEIDARSLMDLVGAGHSLARVSREAHERVLPQGAQAQFRTRDRKPVLPSILPTKTRQSSYDTFENRFVKHVLRQFEVRARTVAQQLASAGKSDLSASARGIEATCRSMLRSPFFAEVGVLTSMQATSQVLLRDDSYNRILRIYQEFLLSSDVDWDGIRQVQENRDIAELYEMWVYLEVVRVLHRMVGGRLTSPDAVMPAVASSSGGLFVSLLRDKASGLRMQGSGGAVITAYYNRSFAGRSGPPTPTPMSYSLPLRPDVVVEIEDAAGRSFVVLDAKYRVDTVGTAFTTQDDSDAEEAVVASTFRAPDVHKMHAYRDAIDNVFAALAVYPGVEGQAALYPRAGFSDTGGVGAVPLRPGRGVRRLALTRTLQSALSSGRRDLILSAAQSGRQGSATTMALPLRATEGNDA
jgi:predicted component of viral defense system (DUF524 family)